MEVQNGVGNFLGKFDAQSGPLKGLSADSTQGIADKAEVDAIMKDRYKFFEPGKTVFLPRN